MGMIDSQYRAHIEKNLKPIAIKDLKEGDVFYEKTFLHLYKFTALEDAKDKGYITIAKEQYKQYQILVLNEHNEERYLLVTEGLSYYNGKYYKYT